MSIFMYWYMVSLFDYFFIDSNILLQKEFVMKLTDIHVDSKYNKNDFNIFLTKSFGIFFIFYIFLLLLDSYNIIEKSISEILSFSFCLAFYLISSKYLKIYTSSKTKNDIAEDGLLFNCFRYAFRFIKYAFNMSILFFGFLMYQYKNSKINGINLEYIEAIEKFNKDYYIEKMGSFFKSGSFFENIDIFVVLIVLCIIVAAFIFICELMYNFFGGNIYLLKYYRNYFIYIITFFLFFLLSENVIFNELMVKLSDFEPINKSVSVFKTDNKIFFENNVFLLIDKILDIFIYYILMIKLTFGGICLKFKDGDVKIDSLIGKMILFLVFYLFVQEFIIISGVLLYLDFNYSYFSNTVINLCLYFLIIVILNSKTINYINSNFYSFLIYIAFSFFLLFLIISFDKSFIIYMCMIALFILFITVPDVINKLSKKHTILNNLGFGFHDKTYYFFNFFTFLIFLILLILFNRLEFEIFVPIFAKLILVIFALYSTSSSYEEKTFVYKILEFPVYVYMTLNNIMKKIRNNF